MEIICNFGVRKNDKIYLNDSSNQYLNHNKYFKTLKGRYYKKKNYWIFNLKNLSQDFSEKDIQKIIVQSKNNFLIESHNNQKHNDKDSDSGKNSEKDNNSEKNDNYDNNSEKNDNYDNNSEENDNYDNNSEKNSEEDNNKIDNSSQTYSDYFVESVYSTNLKDNISEKEQSEDISENEMTEVSSEVEENSEKSNHLKNYLEVEGGYTSKYNDNSKQDDNMSNISDITNTSKEIYEEQKSSNIFNTEYIMHKNISIISNYKACPDSNLYLYVKKYIDILQS